MRPTTYLTLLLAFCALGCGTAGVPMGAVTQVRTALDATTEPIRVIATELTLVGPVLDEACTPVVVAPAPEPVPAGAPPPAGPFAPVPAAPPAPPAATAPRQQLLPPAGCAKALPGLDRVSAELERLQDHLEVLNRGIGVIETAAALARQ